MAFIKYAEKDGTIYDYNPRSVADQFSTSTTYAVGDYAYYDGTLYRFHTAHPAGSWIGTDVDEVVVASELKEHGADITELKNNFTELDETAARIDGSYDTMTVGNAKQLTSNVGINDKAPYLFRTAGGANDIGDREEDTIIGGSVVWNQLIEDVSETTGDVTRTKTGNLTLEISGTRESDTTTYRLSSNNIKWVEGRKYFISIGRTQGQDVTIMRGASVTVKKISTGFEGTIYSPGADSNNYLGMRIHQGVTYNLNLTLMVCDLTAMFGATIADYAHSLETAEEGKGIAWLKKYGFFTKDYYEYCAPTLKHVSGLSSHSMVGFNAYDNTTGKAKVAGDNVYQITGTYTALTLNGETITPDASGYFTPSVSGELIVTGGNGTTTCVHLVWDGERDGEYEAYNVNSYTLDDSLTLCGIPKLDAGNNLYYDGDKYLPDGTVERRYYAADLGEVTWTTVYTGDVNKTMRTTVLGKGYDRTKKIKGICDSYNIVGYVSAASYADEPDEMSIGIYSYRQPSGTSQTLYLVIPKDSTPSGHLVYEVATTTTEIADPYQTPQVVDDWGTEEYVCTPDSDGVVIPVGHDTFYSANLKAKLEMSPDSPSDGDGDYIVRQTGGLNEYAKLVIPAELPTSPSEDGAYTLKVTVAEGTATLAWVADT